VSLSRKARRTSSSASSSAMTGRCGLNRTQSRARHSCQPAEFVSQDRDRHLRVVRHVKSTTLLDEHATPERGGELPQAVQVQRRYAVHPLLWATSDSRHASAPITATPPTA
jgi:hypothetical protein